MKKNAFTLIELLSVIVIFAITFLIVVPSMNSLIGSSERKEIELIEERVLSAAKEYVNNFDGSFYKNFYKEGDTSYVYKSDLINAGLINEKEISKLNTFAGVKGELLSNDRIRYTVEYLNTSNNEYTNEELYLMIQNMNKNIENNTNKIDSMNSNNTNSNVIEDLQNHINDLTNKDNTNNIFLQNYPIGSIYVSTESSNPGTKFGGTWVAFGAGRTLVGVDSSQTEFASVGLTGGEKEHTLTINEMPSHSHSLKSHTFTWGITSGYTNPVYIPGATATAGYPTVNDLVTGQGSHNYSNYTGSGQAHNNMPPYITVYMWKRTA